MSYLCALDEPLSVTSYAKIMALNAGMYDRFCVQIEELSCLNLRKNGHAL